MGEEFLFEWTFEPGDYFEDSVQFECAHGTIRVVNGRAEIYIPADQYLPDHSLRNQLHAELDAGFLAAQVLNHRSYALTKPNVSKLYPSGRRDTWVFPEGTSAQLSGNPVDLVLTDASGRKYDSRKDRVQRRIDLAQLAAQYVADPVANAILRSYAAAVNDPKNELIHLYEIREALKAYFGGEKSATKKLNVTNGSWSLLGRMANNEPLSQGRHRGQHIGLLRDATDGELSAARGIARQMIEGYLHHVTKAKT